MRPILFSSLFALCLIPVGVGVLGAQHAVPAPDWVRSVEIMEDGAPVFLEAGAGTTRRGTVDLGTRLPFRRRLAAPGCETGYWVEVGDSLFVCEHYVRGRRSPPRGVALPSVAPGEILPLDYAFVMRDGTRAFAHPADLMTDEYYEAMGAGFGMVVTGQRLYEGIGFVRNRRGLWIEEEAVRRARGSSFAGVALEGGAPLDLAWVLRAGARVHERRGGRVVRRASRREIVHVAEVARGWVRLASGGFMRDADLARATRAPRPEGASASERWLDVNVEEQVLVAYEGDRAVFATLVSTGRASRAHATPLGAFRIWVKLAYSDMDNLQRQDVERNYAIESVPWVQYFEGSNGLHAAFWHDDFGRRRSHGCVNLSPRDARFIFDFTGPALPPGWEAILPTPNERATLVQVR